MNERYFAYGSNLCVEQMEKRVGVICQGDDRPTIARLANYRLAFNMYGDDGQVFANIVSGGDGVVGVVYTLSSESLLSLDAYEAGYQRQHVDVALNDGGICDAIAYIARAEHVGRESAPSAAYLQRILAGARRHGLPEATLREIEAAALAARHERPAPLPKRAGPSPIGD